MTNEEEPTKDLRGQIEDVFAEWQRKNQKVRRESLERSTSPSVRLALQAYKAEDLRDELEEVVFSEMPDEEWAAWALLNLSPHSDALVLAEANLTVTRHNIKTLFRQGL